MVNESLEGRLSVGSSWRARTDDGRKRARARGVKFGRPVKLTAHQRQEAIQRLGRRYAGRSGWADKGRQGGAVTGKNRVMICGPKDKPRA
jgi:hypothetical protein